MIEVLIVDDQKTVQEIIKGYIEADSIIDVVGCANNGQEALDMVDLYKPDIVLMDIEMPILDGIAATEIISEKYINTNVLIISVHTDDNYLNTALRVGAKGYLLKNTPEKELINAIYSAHKGYFQLGPGLLEKYLYKVSDLQASNQELQQLKTFVMQQSRYFENGANGAGEKHQSNNGRNRKGTRTQADFLEHRYNALKKDIHTLNNRINQQNKKIAFLQQLGILVILGSSLLVVLLILFSA
ncbi:MAG: response regulator transcription factor [Cyanobacteria bacterium P01_G01_bin.19]